MCKQVNATCNDTRKTVPTLRARVTCSRSLVTTTVAAHSRLLKTLRAFTEPELANGGLTCLILAKNSRKL